MLTVVKWTAFFVYFWFMVNIDELHQITFAISAKSRAAFPSPDEWNNFANYANIDLFNQYNDIRKAALLKNKEGHTLNMPSSLKVFVVNEAPITFTTGVGNIPTDQSTNLQLTVNGYPVKKVDYNRREAYLKSTIDAPTLIAPIYCETGTSLLIYPTTITNGLLTYLKTPTTVKWAYVLRSILTMNTLVPGTGYTNTGAYTNVPLIGGTGSGATADFAIIGGVVSSVNINQGGKGYTAGDLLTASTANLGGTGSGFTIKVATISANRPVYDSVNSVNSEFQNEEKVKLASRILAYMGLQVRDQQIEQAALLMTKQAS
jgi:hypothetical protein